MGNSKNRSDGQALNPENTLDGHHWAGNSFRWKPQNLWTATKSHLQGGTPMNHPQLIHRSKVSVDWEIRIYFLNWGLMEVTLKIHKWHFFRWNRWNQICVLWKMPTPCIEMVVNCPDKGCRINSFYAPWKLTWKLKKAYWEEKETIYKLEITDFPGSMSVFAGVYIWSYIYI